MARMTKAEIQGYFWLAVVGGTIWLIVSFTEAVGGVENLLVLGAIALVFVFIFGYFSKRRREEELAARLQKLLKKYNNAEVADNIITQTIWVGETEEQLLESLGNPVDVDQKVLKTKKKEVWKYGHEGGNRFRLRITLENDIVVGWDQR